MSQLKSEREEESEPYFNFINSIKSQSTKELYESNIKLFMKFCNVNNLEALLKIDAQRYLLQYVVSLREKKLATNSITSRLNPVFHFYEMNDVIINKKKIRMFKGEFMKKARDRAYTHEEVKKILDVSDLRMKVIILLMASTGMRVGALPSLKLRNLEKIDSDYNLYKVTIYEGSNEEYYSFTTPECASFIDMYLEYRSKNGEKLTKDSYLIRDQFDIMDIEQIRNHSKGIATNTIKSLIGVALIKAGVNSIDHTSKYNRKEVARCHGFRKFFTTVWINSKLKLNPEIREMLLGHKIQLASSYYRPSQYDLLQEYLKAVNDLTINEEHRLKIKVQKLESEKNEITTLKNQVNRNEEANRILASTFKDVLDLLRVANDNTGSGTEEYDKQVDKILSIKNRLKQKGIRIAGGINEEFMT